jgi:CspA family cold shock protein
LTLSRVSCSVKPVETYVFGFALLRCPVWPLNKAPLNPDVSIAHAFIALADERQSALKQRSASQLRKTKMPSGTVKFFNTQKGFGFITPADGSKDVFVHISAVERAGMSTLNEGQRLNYEIVTERGKQAASNLSNA